MGLGKDFRKLFYGGGIIAIVLSLLLIWRTVKDVIPAIGLSGCAVHLGMSIFFLLVGIGMVFLARRDAKREAAQQAAEEKDQV